MLNPKKFKNLGDFDFSVQTVDIPERTSKLATLKANIKMQKMRITLMRKHYELQCENVFRNFTMLSDV